MRDGFVALGAQPVEAAILLPAETLLDLYGEDIRARAYVTADPLRGERMLRPDFTVPVVLQHMANGADPARYTYAGEVFRKQETDPERPSEYLQVGFELFDGADPARADAEVFAAIADMLAPLPLRAAIGDIGILTAAVAGLAISADRRAALMRHVWRPRRFRTLMERFAGRKGGVPAGRRALLARAARGEDVLAGAGPRIGLRTGREVRDRLARLAADAEETPMAEGQLALVDQITDLRDKAPVALERLRDLAVDLPSIAGAVARLAARLEAMEARGVDTGALDFEGSYGRTTLEYYDGFVFGFYAEGRPDLPPVSTGGRYDALTRVLGGGRSIPAVGGMIRPATALQLGWWRAAR